MTSSTTQPTPGPTSPRRLIAIVAALVVLVAIAAFLLLRPKLYHPSNPAEERIVKLMSGDLIALRTAERAYYLSTHQFTGSIDSTFFLQTVGVGLPKLTLKDDGWYATLTDPRLPGVTCAIAVATDNPVWKKAEEGLPVCGR